jgi:hypothetical protein
MLMFNDNLCNFGTTLPAGKKRASKSLVWAFEEIALIHFNDMGFWRS